MSYQVGEVVLMEHHGWLKAFRVVSAKQVNDHEIEYQMALLGLENEPGWIKPA